LVTIQTKNRLQAKQKKYAVDKLIRYLTSDFSTFLVAMLCLYSTKQ